jgi:hypothetical protein
MTKRNFSIASALLIVSSLSMAQAASATSAKETLKDIQESALAAASEAEHLEQFIANPALSPEAHSGELIALKEEVNRMGRDAGSLEAERDSLAPWEQQALDKTMPLLKETAANTENAIEYFNENRTHLWGDNYREYASNISRNSEQITKTLKDYLKYAKAHDQERRLEQILGAAGN